MKTSMLAFLLALVMVLSLFAGCGKQEETPAQETEQSPADCLMEMTSRFIY